MGAVLLSVLRIVFQGEVMLYMMDDIAGIFSGSAGWDQWNRKRAGRELLLCHYRVWDSQQGSL